jgi:hypothetical protein
VPARQNDRSHDSRPIHVNVSHDDLQERVGSEPEDQPP